MMKKTLASLVLACLCAAVSAQAPDKSSQYFSLQANQLLRQLLNFGTAVPVNNPYLINFSTNNDSTGFGVNIGLGYTFDESSTGDAIFERTTDTNDLFFRLGLDRKYSLGKKWLVGWGLDVVLDKQSNYTHTKNNSEFNKSEINTDNKATGVGFGPRFLLHYRISERVLIGTEATYYFKSIKNKGEVESKHTTQQFDPITGQFRDVTVTEKTEVDDDFKKLQLNVPAVIFLTLKF